MSITRLLHLDGDGFPLCARSRRPAQVVSEWLGAHFCHVQAHASADEQTLVNQYVEQGIAKVTEQCKGQPPGQRCCEPQWSASDTRIVNLFTDARPEELERAMHIPIDEFVKCVEQARNGSCNDSEIGLAIKLWNSREWSSNSGTGAIAQKFRHGPHSGLHQIQGDGQRRNRLENQRQQKQNRRDEQIAELKKQYGEAWFPKSFWPKTEPGSVSTAGQPKENFVISSIYTIIQSAKAYTASPQDLWAEGGLLFEACSGGKFGPQAAKLALERAKERYPRSDQGCDTRGSQSLSPISPPYNSDKNRICPTLLTISEPGTYQQSPDTICTHVPLDQGTTKAVYDAGRHFPSKACKEGKNPDSEYQVWTPLRDSGSIIVLDDDDNSATPAVDKGQGLDAYLESRTLPWTSTPLHDGMKALCNPLAEKRGFAYLDPLWSGGEPQRLPERCFDEEHRLKKLLIPLHTQLKPAAPSKEEPRGHWSLALVTGSPETKDLAVTLYDSVSSLGLEAGRRLANWLESWFQTRVPVKEKPCLQQNDGHNCGALVLLFAYRLLLGDSLEKPSADPRGEILRLIAQQAANQHGDGHPPQIGDSASPSSLFSAEALMDVDEYISADYSAEKGGPLGDEVSATSTTIDDDLTDRYESQRLELLETLRGIEGLAVLTKSQIAANLEDLQRLENEIQTLTSELGKTEEDMVNEKQRFDDVLQVLAANPAGKSSDGFWNKFSREISEVCTNNKKAFDERRSVQQQRMLEMERQIEETRLTQDKTRCKLKQLQSSQDKLKSMQRAKDALSADGQERRSST